MALRGDGDSSVRESDGRRAGQDYDDDVKRRARLAWTLEQSFQMVGRRTGIDPRTIQKWKERGEPDGVSWEKFRDELEIAPIDRVSGTLLPENEVSMRRRIFEIAQKLLDTAVESLEEGPLYDSTPSDPERAQVKYLYNELGRKVPLDGIRPASATEVVKLVETATDVGDRQIEAVKELERLKEDEQLQFQQWYGQMVGIMYQVLGRAAVEKFTERAEELGADRGEVELERSRVEVVDGEVSDAEDN